MTKFCIKKQAPAPNHWCAGQGVITTYVLVFGLIFLIMLGGLFSFILLQLRQSAEKAAWSQALHIAEAGINYYKWCLNHEIEDTIAKRKRIILTRLETKLDIFRFSQPQLFLAVKQSRKKLPQRAGLKISQT